MLGCTLGLGYGTRQSAFGTILGWYTPFFLIYVGIASMARREHIGFWMVLAVVLRLALLPAEPLLSDDVYRFIWDGRLWIQGISPFAHLPAWYMEPGHEVKGLSEALFQQLNSPEYFTIYPPVAQLVFACAAWLSPNELWGCILVMRLFLLACELGSLWLLLQLNDHFGSPPRRVLWYALNPLVIVELMGNLHFEAAMIFFLLLALWWGGHTKLWPAAAAMALSIGTKLIPLMFGPLWIRRWGWPHAWRWLAGSGLIVALLFVPVVHGPLWDHFGESLDLYFRKFEFNASIYYLLRWLRWQQLGYNDIARLGPALALLTAAIILIWAWRERRADWASLPQSMMWALTCYLLLATTVHPWYVTTLVALASLTPWRFPIVWSGVAILSYHAYAHTPTKENFWFVGLEYAVVLGWLWVEWRQQPARSERTI